MSKSRLFLIVLSITLFAGFAPVAKAADVCTELEMTRAKLVAVEQLSRLGQYVRGKRNYESAQQIIGYVERDVQYAAKCNADVEEITSQLPELAQSARLVYAQKTMDDIRDFAAGKTGGTAQWFIAHAFDAIEDVKAGPSTPESISSLAKLEKWFPEFCRLARFAEAESLVRDLEKRVAGKASSTAPIGIALNEAREAINTAMLSGADVTGLQKRLPKDSQLVQMGHDHSNVN